MNVNITLSLPAGFECPALLKTTTAEENAEILRSGCRILVASRDRSSELSLGERVVALERAQKAELEKTQKECAAELEKRRKAAEAEKTEIQRGWSVKEAELVIAARKAEQRAESEARLHADMAARLADETALVRERTRASMQAELDNATAKAATAASKASEAEAEKAAAKAEAAAAREAKMRAETSVKILVAEAKVEMERAKAAEVEKARVETETKATQERKVLLTELKEQHQKALDGCEARHQKDQNSLLELTARKAGSSTKGADFEDDMEHLINKAFGVKSDFKVIVSPKEGRKKTGDEITEMDGFRTMYEFKDYKSIANKDEVAKAHRDMELRPECSALVFVSNNTEIAGHQKPGHFDIGMLADGRPALYIGKFDDSPDKVAYLQMVHLITIELLRLAKKAAESGEGGLLESYKEKVTAMRRSFLETKEDMGDHGKKMKHYQQRQKEAWETLKSSWDDIVSRFGRRLARALKDDDEDESCEEGLAAAEEMAAAKELDATKEAAVIRTSPPLVRSAAAPVVALSPYADIKVAAEVVALPPLAVGPPAIAAPATPVEEHRIANERKRLQALWIQHKVQPEKPSKTLKTLRQGLKAAGIAF